MKDNRRSFLKKVGFLSVGFAGLKTFAEASEKPVKGKVDNSKMLLTEGYGPLLPDPNKIIDLPKGFSYQILAKKGERMSDGLIRPAMCDGMAAFNGKDGKVILVCNHENSQSARPSSSAFGKKYELLEDSIKSKLYDPGNEVPLAGGTTTLVYDPKSKKLEKSFLSLGGTERNCAGGPTPWNSWITCEETTNKKGKHWKVDHGYNFEVPASEDIELTAPVALKDMGRFNHEAVAVDPRNSIVYQTEDRGDGSIYRFIPNVPGDLAKGGKLQALAIIGKNQCDTRNYKEQSVDESRYYDVEWVDLDDVESPKDDLRYRAQAKGACIFARGEGMWYSQNEIYFACTNGGRIQQGQIFNYKPSPYEGQDKEKDFPGKLELFVESKNSEILSFADNLTVASWGDVVIAEDTYGERRSKLVGITPQGACYDLARNAYNSSELAGVCFSPDYKTLFFNIQKTGLTLAVEGPWSERS